MDKLEELKQIIEESNYLVFFGGAGVSTESNLKDFRSKDGLYTNNTYPYPPETMLSQTFFLNHTRDFYNYYFNEMVSLDALPNPAHTTLAKMETDGKLKAIITQNIDGLHQKAGSKKVYELHGSIHRNYCLKCKKFYALESILDEEIPRCDCSGIIKPDVVLYQEQLNSKVVEEAIDHIANADTLIVGGTSLVVYPAAGLIKYFKGKKIVLINMEETPYDNLADLVINDKIGEVLSKVYK